MKNASYQRAIDIKAGRIKRLYLAGHNHKSGHAISLEFADAPPVRYMTDLRHARRVVDRFNRRFGTLNTPASPADKA